MSPENASFKGLFFEYIRFMVFLYGCKRVFYLQFEKLKS